MKYILYGLFIVFVISCGDSGVLRISCLGDPTCSVGLGTADLTDDDNSVLGFAGGAHLGTTYSGGVLSPTTGVNYSTLDPSWTPEYDNLLIYLPGDDDFEDKASGRLFTFNGGGPFPTLNADAQVGTNSMDFSASTSKLLTAVTGDLPLGTAERTFSWWFKVLNFPGAGGESMIIYSGGGVAGEKWIMSVGDNDNLDFAFQGLRFTILDAQLETNTWYHIGVTLEDGGGTLGDIKIYLNGHYQENADRTYVFGNDASVINTQNSKFDVGAAADVLLDEIAFWDKELSASDIQLIYQRQRATHAGIFDSRVMDGLELQSWDGASWLTTLPFGKELPDGSGTANSESTDDYSLLTGSTDSLDDDDLMEQIVALYHFNEASWVGAGAVLDSSGNGNHLTNSSNVQSDFSLFSRSAYFDRTGHFQSIAAVNIGTETTISAWVYTPFIPTTQSYTILSNTTSVWPIDGFAINLHTWNSGDGKILLSTGDSGSASNRDSSSGQIRIGEWNHVVIQITTAGAETIYLNGVQVDNTGGITAGYTTNQTLRVGAYLNDAGRFEGYMDELAIWGRTLTEDEIIQLYRRGANRLKLQLRSCAQSDCSDQEALSDRGWKGKAGGFESYFSELQNNTSIDINGDGDGSAQTSSPSLTFDDYNAGSLLTPGRYIQYRAILESDDQNTVCNAGASTCLPQLESITISP